MGRFVDSVIAYRILHMLVTPFDKTEAFRLGIIDKHGKELKRMKDLNTVAERDAYSILHRMVFRLKRIVEKVPVENKKLASFTAALALIKENYHTKVEPVNLEVMFLDRLENLQEEDIYYTESLLTKHYIKPFSVYMEEAPANNAVATPGIAGFPPDEPPVKKKDQKKYIHKNTMFRR